MKIPATQIAVRAQLAILFVCIATLAILSFIPDSRRATTSVETRFHELSPRGLNIVPASCASSPSYFHQYLTYTTDNGGWYAPPGTLEAGGYSVTASMYVCVNNNGANYYFIPGKSAAELSNFKAHPPSDVQAW